MTSEELLEIITEILDSAHLETQQALYRLVEVVLVQEGYKNVYDSWDPESLELIRVLAL